MSDTGKTTSAGSTRHQMTAWADLHTHTTFSDGSLSPEELLRIAREIGLKALAITDHDTVEALQSALKLAPQYGIEIIPAIELGTHVNGTELHFLGYLIDIDSDTLSHYLEEIRITRRNRAVAILKKLSAYGLHLRLEEVLRRAGSGSIGRPHIAAAMVENGLVSSFQEAFDLWIGDGKPAHVNKGQHSPEELIHLIHEADGIAILAHPGNRVSQSLIRRFIRAGLDGIELIHPSHDDQNQQMLKEIARKYGLLMTGGSDFHGFRGHQNVFGNFIIPYKVVEQLKKYKIYRSRKSI